MRWIVKVCRILALGLTRPIVPVWLSVYPVNIHSNMEFLVRWQLNHVKTASSTNISHYHQGKAITDLIYRSHILIYVRWFRQKSMFRSSKSEPSVSTDIRATGSNVSLQIGANPKESTIVCEGDLRVKLWCHLYVSASSICAEAKASQNFGYPEDSNRCILWRRKLLISLLLDWLRFKQEDSPHDAVRP